MARGAILGSYRTPPILLVEIRVALAGGSMIAHTRGLRMICGCDGRMEREHLE
jgi:hypothetical protein